MVSGGGLDLVSLFSSFSQSGQLWRVVWSVHFQVQVSVSQVSGGGSGLVSQVSQFSQVSGGGSGQVSQVSQFSQVSGGGSGLVSQVSQFSQVSGGGSGLVSQVSQFSQVSPVGSGQSVFKFEPVMSVSVCDHPPFMFLQEV